MKIYFLTILILLIVLSCMGVIVFYSPYDIVYNFIFNNKEMRRWKEFLRYANDFVYVGTSHDGNHWFVLTDEFKRVRYHAIVWNKGICFDGESSIHPLKNKLDIVCSPFIRNYSKKFSKILMNNLNKIISQTND